MSSGAVRRVSRQDIQLVQNLIERCLQLYMNQKEVVETLLVQAKIEPGFTELVWQKLEEENREFFQAYYLRLMVKHQINEFNKLLEQQVRLMRQIAPTGVASLPTSNGSHVPSLHQNSVCYAPEHTGPSLKPENMHHPIGSSLRTAFTNGGTSLPSLPSRINGGMIKTEAGYSGSSPYMFGGDGNVLETHPTIGDASVASFSSVESSSQPLNETLLDADTSSFGFLGQIPLNISLSDLTAHFNHSSDILECYPRSPFLSTDTENFLDSREREHQDNKRLDTISEGLSYEDFGSE